MPYAAERSLQRTHPSYIRALPLLCGAASSSPYWTDACGAPGGYLSLVAGQSALSREPGCPLPESTWNLVGSLHTERMMPAYRHGGKGGR
jgi:hypothetical protein